MSGPSSFIKVLSLWIPDYREDCEYSDMCIKAVNNWKE